MGETGSSSDGTDLSPPWFRLTRLTALIFDGKGLRGTGRYNMSKKKAKPTHVSAGLNRLYVSVFDYGVTAMPQIESDDTRNFQLNPTKGFAVFLPYLFFHFTFLKS